METRVRNGRWEKKCTTCGVWRDAEEGFYWRLSKIVDALPYQMDPRPGCKHCENKEAGDRLAPHLQQHGLIRWDAISAIVESAIKRVGQKEFSRRTGLSQNTLWLYRRGDRLRVTKVNAACMLHVARDIFQSGELRTREEIHYGRRVHEPPNDGAATVPE